MKAFGGRLYRPDPAPADAPDGEGEAEAAAPAPERDVAPTPVPSMKPAKANSDGHDRDALLADLSLSNPLFEVQRGKKA